MGVVDAELAVVDAVSVMSFQPFPGKNKPHRPGCPCGDYDYQRCYPCRVHPTAILTGKQWAAAKAVYAPDKWSGDSLVEEVKKEIAFEHRRKMENKVPAEDHHIGNNAVWQWLDMSPEDLVAAVRHVETHYDEDKGDDYCEPLLDDPDCLAGTCRHAECDRARFKKTE